MNTTLNTAIIIQLELHKRIINNKILIEENGNFLIRREIHIL